MFPPSSHPGLTKSSFNPVFFSPDIRRIFLGWCVGLTKNLEPLNLQSIPPASAREAATCFGVEGSEDTGFSALRRRYASVYAGVFFQTCLLTQFITGGKGEAQLAVRGKFPHCFCATLPFHHASKELEPCRWMQGWREAAKQPRPASQTKSGGMESRLPELFGVALQILHTLQILVLCS